MEVTARLSSPSAGTASGARNATKLHFSFTVARPAATQTTTSTSSSGTTTSSSAKTPASQSFKSVPNLYPPVVKATSDPDTSSGDLFVDVANARQDGVMILNNKGQVVWFHPTGEAATDLSVQRYQGKPVLTWWQGGVVDGHGEGEDVILNQHYQTVATVHGGEGYSADLHDFQLTGQGTALITAYVPVKANLTSIGGPSNGTVLDSVIQEVDVKTGQVVWEWHSLGHVPVSASYAGKPSSSTAYDYFHINSIQQLPNGNLLISSRNTWAVYEISRKTGQTIWTLGGKNSSFSMGKGASFEWQHDARLEPNGTLTLFDDGASPKEESQSRALVLRLNTQTMRASLVHAYTHSPTLLADSQGSVQELPNGNVFVGWGAEPDFSEYTASGKQIFNGSFELPVQSYRAYRFTWQGTPTTKPAIAVSTAHSGGLTVYASWNGATGVARWQLLAGPRKSDLSVIDTTASTGFETQLRTTHKERYVEVRALNSSGQVLGTSLAAAS